MPDDVLIVGQEDVVRQLGPVEEQLHALVESRDAVLAHALKSGIAHMLGQVLEGGHAEEVEHPVGQYQPVLKFKTE